MPTIHKHPSQLPEKPTQGPSPAPGSTQAPTQAKEVSQAQAKAQEACPPVQGKAVEATQAKPSGDSNQIKQGAQGKAQTNLSLGDLSKQLEASKARVDALDKAKQKSDSAFKAKLDPLEAEIAKNKARIKELDHELDSLWELRPEGIEFDPNPQPAKPDPEMELINKIKDPDVKLKMLKQRADRLSKELKKDLESLDLPEIKVIDSRDLK